MVSITRTKVLIAAVIVTLVYAIGLNAGSGHAATGGTLTTLSADPAFTSTSTGVTSSAAFPDGGTTGQCMLVFSGTAKTNPPTAVGNCTGISASIVCGSVPFDKTSSATGDMKGAAFSVNGTKQWTGQYDQGVSAGCLDLTKTPGVSNGKAADASLAATITGVPAGANVIAYFNNDTQASRGGCFTALDAGAATFTALQCVNLATAGPDGAFYEYAAGAATTTVGETTCAANGTVGCAANATLAAVIIEQAGATTSATATPGAAGTATAGPAATATSVPLAAHPLSVHRAHGLTTLRWFSSAHVRGFNVYNGTKKLNTKLVTSKTGHYTFHTAKKLSHPWVQPVA